MKNSKIICCIFLFIILLCGCSKDVDKLDTDDAEFILFDNQYYYLCGLDENNTKVEIHDSVKRTSNVSGLGYIYEFSLESPNLTYLKTQTDLKRDTYLQTISKDGNEKNTIKLQKDFYTACQYEGDIYAISSYVDENPYLVLEVYDSNLSLNYTEKFEYDAAIIFPSGIVVSEENIYLFCGIIDKNSSYGDITNYLFEFDLKFNLKKSTDLKLYDGSYQHACKIDDLIYLAKTTEGLDENKYAIGSNKIDIYDLSEMTLKSNYISLEYKYPKHIRYDEKNNNIIFMHDRYSLGMNCYSIYNLKTKTITSLEFDYGTYGDYSIYFSKGENNYYFQTPKTLIVYNLTNENITEYDLNELELVPGIVALK